ncbi:MAG: Na+/H+ antiporter subunit E [Bradyrhizobium sp.]|uniref:Na+/H+ antiporter subunit E n=1 Tax=Bradyrhizobium sp. TaxID=376 RepID=UPI00271A34A8|nr:Na+/H+ antiporter subunit E [Bradyrhizobium sp.]MDO9562283.1 Na+/H+ antiporter subunit E [Bradyrhizobium sp.]MDP3693624.1 Na+/H+ antiporter subunit E [Bradyrhizobium sp.]
MTLFPRVLPQPTITLGIMGLWMVLAPSASLGNLLLAVILGVSIPWITRSFWPDRPYLARPLTGIVLFVRVVGDIIVASWEVARLVVGPLDRLKPAFIDVPIEIDDPFVATLLASIVSLTPGTVSVDIDRAAGILNVHALNVADEAEMIAAIKRRYEAPLKRVFGC